MTFNSKTLIILALLLAVAIGLTTTFMKSAKLVKDFEQNIEKKQFIPEANSIELSEIDTAAHRSWKIKAKKSTGNTELSKIEANQVEAQVFDENSDKLKMHIKAPKAYINRETQISTLEGPAEVLMVEKGTKMIADRFIIKRGKPIEALGHVKVLLSSDGIKHINAKKAIISEDMNDITLYEVSKSPVSSTLMISGGKMQMEQSGSKTSKIILSNGAWVKNGETTCQSSRLDVFVDGNGNPSVAVFTGSAVAVQKGTRIKAQKIEYIIATEQVKASGNVRTEII